MKVPPNLDTDIVIGLSLNLISMSHPYSNKYMSGINRLSINVHPALNIIFTSCQRGNSGQN